MNTVNIYDAKTHLSKLIDQAAGGDDILIARSGKPVARLTSLTTLRRHVRFGVLKGEIRISEDFDEPLPDDVIKSFEG